MAGSTFPRLKVWEEDEDVLTRDLNGEFNNILANMKPSGMDDYSVNISQMQIQTNPGDVGSESLPTALAGELERLRYVIARLVGKPLWYQSPALSLEDARNAVQSAIGLPANRIVSGKVTTGNQPAFLQAAGNSLNVTLKASPTEPFICLINEVQLTFQSDIVFNNLSVAPNSNNTVDVDDARLSSQEWSKIAGEDLDQLTVASMSSEISSQTGNFVALKNPQAGNELMLAQVHDSLTLRRIFRGYFFNSALGAIPRDYLADNDTLELMRLTWVFLNSDGTLDVTYRPPTYSGNEPIGASIGDYWLDFSVDQWKRKASTGFVVANALLVGQCVQSTTACIATRSADFFKVLNDDNSLYIEPRSIASVKTKFTTNYVNVYGNRFVWLQNEMVWNYPADLDSGVPQGTDKSYYFYLTDEGKPKISDVYPYNRLRDLKGWYHPHKPWRAIGGIYRNGSGQFDSYKIMSFAAMKDSDRVGKVEGVMDMYDVETPNPGYLPMNPAFFTTVPRDLFPRLYAKMGDRCGNGDGSTSFHVPRIAGGTLRFTDETVGEDADRAGRTASYSGGVTGAETGSFQASDNKSHVHGVSDPGHNHLYTAASFVEETHNGGGGARFAFTAATSVSGTGVSIVAQGSSDARPPNTYAYGYLKY